LIWISEVWIRGDAKNVGMPIRNLPIKGEMLQVIGINADGLVKLVQWDIVRERPDAKPSLVIRENSSASVNDTMIPNFLIPVRRAFARLYGKA
jgi:hypothetical protein